MQIGKVKQSKKVIRFDNLIGNRICWEKDRQILWNKHQQKIVQLKHSQLIPFLNTQHPIQHNPTKKNYHQNLLQAENDYLLQRILKNMQINHNIQPFRQVQSLNLSKRKQQQRRINNQNIKIIRKIKEANSQYRLQKYQQHHKKHLRLLNSMKSIRPKDLQNSNAKYTPNVQIHTQPRFYKTDKMLNNGEIFQILIDINRQSLLIRKFKILAINENKKFRILMEKQKGCELLAKAFNNSFYELVQAIDLNEKNELCIKISNSEQKRQNVDHLNVDVIPQSKRQSCFSQKFDKLQKVVIPKPKRTQKKKQSLVAVKSIKKNVEKKKTKKVQVMNQQKIPTPQIYNEQQLSQSQNSLQNIDDDQFFNL